MLPAWGLLVAHQLCKFALPCAATQNLVMRACLLLQNGRRTLQSQPLVFCQVPLCEGDVFPILRRQ